jgi:hypothetical protein
MPQFSVQLAPSQLAQTINPWSWSFGQVGLFNVNLGTSGDPAVEARVLDEVGSYGRQLGRIGDVMGILIDRLDASSLSPDERQAVEALRLQLQHVDVIKREGA